MKTITRYCAALAVLGCFTLLGSNVAEASHFRGGYITYQPTGNPGEVEITNVVYYRRTGSQVVGSTFSEGCFNFGDGNSDCGAYTVTAFSSTDVWMVGIKTMTHTYANPTQTYTAFYTSCCRVNDFSQGITPDGMGNRSDESFRLEADILPTNTSPNTSSGPFVGVPRSTSTTYQVPVVVRDGDAFRCRFATSSEFNGGAFGGPSPPNMTINGATCLITWNNNALGEGFWTEQVIIEELDNLGNVKGTVPLDILFEIGAQGTTNTAPVCSIAPGTPAGGGTTDVSATVGVPLAFTVTGTDADAGQTISISPTSLPAGATQTPNPASGASPVVATVNYTPPSVGTELATFSVSDGITSTLCTARINVSPVQTNPCTDPSTAPSYAGGYVLNSAGTRAFVRVSVPQGGVLFEFYNTTNLVVGDPEADTESGTPLAGVTRAGDSFLFAPASPADVYFPVTPAGAGTHVAFFLRITDTCGRTVDVDPSFTLTGVAADEAAGFALDTSWPNPASDAALIRFSLERASAVRLAVYDVLGREVARLVDGQMEAGAHEARFEAGSLPSGVYVYRLEAEGRSLTRSLTVAR